MGVAKPGVIVCGTILLIHFPYVWRVYVYDSRSEVGDVCPTPLSYSFTLIFFSGEGTDKKAYKPNGISKADFRRK